MLLAFLRPGCSCVQMLNEQYRMHPSISHFPSSEFYQGKLDNGEGVDASTSRAWHEQEVSLNPRHSRVMPFRSSCKHAGTDAGRAVALNRVT